MRWSHAGGRTTDFTLDKRGITDYDKKGDI